MSKRRMITTSLVLLLAFSILLASCRTYAYAYTDEVIRDFAAMAKDAEMKYRSEPVFGKSNPFPASFVITGEVIFIGRNDGYILPVEIYEDADPESNRWFSEDPSLVRYAVMIEQTSKARYTFIITDLAYNEQVYKGIAESISDIEEIIEGLIL